MMNRRGFLRTIGIGAAAAALPIPPSSVDPHPVYEASPVSFSSFDAPASHEDDSPMFLDTPAPGYGEPWQMALGRARYGSEFI